MTQVRDVIVIGGSVEGVDSLIRLVNALPIDLPAIVLAAIRGAKVSTLRQFEELNSSSRRKLSVSSAYGGAMPVHGHLYVAPSAQDLVLAPSGAMHLIPSNDDDGGSGKVDRLFKSAAALYGSRVIGVVLSGTGQGGAAGLEAITNVGGVRVVQSPVDATHPEMPTHALLEDHVQHSVILDRMGQLLEDLVKPRTGHKEQNTAVYV